MNRRNFVKTLASLAAASSVSSVASAAGLAGDRSGQLAGQGGEGPGAPVRSFTATSFGLQIEGKDAGFVRSVEGGNAVAEVLSDGAQGGFTGKRLGAIKYEPLRIKVPLVAPAEVTKLVNDAFAGGTGSIRSLAIAGYDLNQKIVSYREAVDAVLIEAGLEQLDATSKEPSVLVLGFQPQLVRNDAKMIGQAGKVALTKQKVATQGSFKLTIDGVDTSAVSSIRPLLASRTALAAASVGASKVTTPIGGRFTTADIQLEVPMSHAQPFMEWFESFAISRSKPEEKSGKIELLSADLKTVLFTVGLSGVGISALRVMGEGSADKVARVQATIYAERFSFA